jgi:MFS family permease
VYFRNPRDRRERPSPVGEPIGWHGAAGTEPGLFPPRSYAIYIVFVLLIVTLSSYLDRQLPALLVKSIKQAFAISDTQFSLLQGPAFALFYTVMGVPFGRLVDHHNRRNLILFGLILWSIMTVLAGLADNYWQFLLTRFGIGLGEACLAPAAYSIIADYFPSRERARAISAYYLALALGAGASLLVGGLILPLLPPEGSNLPFLGTLPPWKLLFVIVGLPGLLIAPLVLTVREPVRRETAGIKPAVRQGSIGEFLRHVARHRISFLCIVSSASMIALVGYGTLGWAPAFFERRFGIAISSSGPALGIMLALAGLSGTLLSGFLSDRWIKRQVPAARFRVMAVAWTIILPASVIWPLVPNAFASYGFLTIELLGFNIGLAAAPVIIQEIVPNRMRGQAITGYLLIAGLLGIGCGPTVVALLTDYLFHNDHSLGPALALVGLTAGCIGISFAWSGLPPYARSWREMAGTFDTGAIPLDKEDLKNSPSASTA